MLRRGGKSPEAPKILTPAYYQRLYELEERHWWSIGMRIIAERLLDPHFHDRRSLRILDAGCGTGSMLSWLERYGESESIVGIDLSHHALGFCQKRRKRQLAQASITQLPFLDGSFDLVTCADVIQHLPRNGSDRKALRECQRVLRPGGFLHLRTNVRLGTQSNNGQGQDYHQYALGEIVDAIAEAGFIVDKVSYANMLPALVATWMRRVSPFDSQEPTVGPDRGLTMRVPPVWLNTALKLVMRGEAWYLAGPQRKLPFGHSLICLAKKPAGVGRTGASQLVDSSGGL